MIESHSQAMLAGVLGAAGLYLISGCGGSARSLTPHDFSGGSASGSTSASVGAPVYSVQTPPVPAAMLLGSSDVAVAEPGAPSDVPVDAAPASRSDREQAAVLDAKVGDVNGRPIIASVFLEDLMPRLRASMQTAPDQSAWRREALTIIRQKLSLTIRDEVLYREAKAQLPPEVRQGLLFYLSRFREQVRLQNSGSLSRADQLLREETGESLEEFLRSRQRQALIEGMLDGAAADYAPVTWTDVRNEYARRYDEFNPPPTVFARMILPPGDAEAEVVQGRLDGGESFAAVAEDRSVNRYRPTSGGLISEQGTQIEGELAEMELVSLEALNSALVSLEPGAWAGPIEYRGGRQGFVQLDRIEQPGGRSLEDGMLQLELRAEIEFRRKRAAQERFFRRLIEDAGFGEDRQLEMSLALLQIAETRLLASGG